jgi:hypothetical protein
MARCSRPRGAEVAVPFGRPSLVRRRSFEVWPFALEISCGLRRGNSEAGLKMNALRCEPERTVEALTLRVT